jgi:hypothetical protein
LKHARFDERLSCLLVLLDKGGEAGIDVCHSSIMRDARSRVKVRQ